MYIFVLLELFIYLLKVNTLPLSILLLPCCSLPNPTYCCSVNHPNAVMKVQEYPPGLETERRESCMFKF